MTSPFLDDLILADPFGSDELGSQLNDTCTTNSQERPLTGQSPSRTASRQTRPQKLQFLQLAEWDEHNSYDEDEPSCLHYSIEWKVSINNRMLSKNTEQDLVLVPGAYWHMFLKPKLEKLLRKKVAQNRYIQCDDTSVVVSVTDRTERDLVKRFEDIDIDWSLVEKQFIKWGELFRSGKKLRVNLSFNYTDSYSTSGLTQRRGNKRGSSATQRMLGELDTAIQSEAEQEGSCQPDTWKAVYALMQCPGPPCSQGPYCWRDPFGKKHYRLRTQHLKALVKFVGEGNVLRSQDDVPESIREQLFAEEQERLERQPRQAASAPTPFPPINITNVLPSSSYQSPSASSGTLATIPIVNSSAIIDFNIPEPLDAAVELYSEWQQSRVVDETRKAEIQKACEMALDDGLDLEQIYKDQDPGFFIKGGVKRGVARRFVADIERWVKRYKVSHDVEL